MKLDDLRAHAVSRSLAPATTLAAAIERAGFVQADPIRAPARAQDLILRHRVEGYRAGDLERRYPELPLEEGVLYAYGFLARSLWHLAHPPDTKGLTKLERRVLAAVQRLGHVHPNDLVGEFGSEREKNAWGGYSRSTKLALDELLWRGLLRVARRDAGVRVYAPAPPAEETPPEARLRTLILTVAAQFAPAPLQSLRAAVRGLRRVADARAVRTVFADLLREGALETTTVGGVDYVWPATAARGGDAPRVVRFLAPFDPVVWDRRRFEHLWGWAYRFEAYTPVAKRERGYYAMPLLWCDRVIGWANARVEQGALQVDLGFVGQRPRGAEFRRELDAELARLETFLSPPALAGAQARRSGT